MTQATLVLPVLGLYMVQIFLQEVPRNGFDIKGIVGNRGHPPELGVFTARLERARNHPMAALPLLLGRAMPVFSAGRDLQLAGRGGGGMDAAIRERFAIKASGLAFCLPVDQFRHGDQGANSGTRHSGR